jgi:hypothetical protein
MAVVILKSVCEDFSKRVAEVRGDYERGQMLVFTFLHNIFKNIFKNSRLR